MVNNEKIEKLEELRKEKLKEYNNGNSKAKIIFIGIIFLLTTPLFFDMKDIPLVAGVTTILILFVILLLSANNAYIFFEEYKLNLVKPFLDNKFNGNYNIDNNEDIKNLFFKIFKKEEKNEHKVVCKDYLYFSHNHQNILISQITSTIFYSIEDTRSPNKNFDGIFLVIETNLNIKNYISLTNELIETFNYIEFENEEFNKYFTVSCENFELAETIISNEVIQNLLKFNKAFKHSFQIFFLENEMYIYIDNYSIFDISEETITKVISIKEINLTLKNIKHNIDVIIKLIDCFRLNTLKGNKNHDKL